MMVIFNIPMKKIKRNLIVVAVLLILTAIALLIFKKLEAPAPERSQESAPIGYIGCSNTRQTVFGYHMGGGEDLWAGGEDRVHDYDQGSFMEWAKGAKRGNKFWRIFDKDLKANPETSAVWVQLCIREPEATMTYEEAHQVLEAIRERIPNVTIYVSPLPSYAENVCEITGTAGIERAQSLAQELDEKNDDVYAGPALEPMVLADISTEEEDRCHPNEQGMRNLGEKMKEFFDPIASQIEQTVWDKRVESAMASTKCSSVEQPVIPSSYYHGPLTDTHLHLPAIPDWSAEDDASMKNTEVPEGRFGGPQALLGWNVKMSEIACTLKQEGTMKNFAFFPVYEEIPGPLLEIADQTIEQYPTLFTPFLMTPGPGDVTPTVNAETLKDMLAAVPDLFQGYGEIGLYKIAGVREGVPPDSEVFQEIYPIVKEHQLVVYFHPGDEQTENFARVLEQHPGITFIVHGDEIQEDILDLMDDHSNIYYGVDAFWGEDMDLFRAFVGKSKEDYLRRMEEEFDDVLAYEVKKWKPRIEKHPDQFLWGTDRGDAVWNYDLEVGQSMVKFARAFISNLDPAVQEKFAYRNAERLLLR
jgi:hypothetical protein